MTQRYITKATAIVVKDPDAHYFKIEVAVTQGDVVLTGFVNSRETRIGLWKKSGQSRV